MLRSVVIALVFVVGAVASGNATAQTRPELAVGQEWSIRASAPTTARVVIGRIEPWGAGKIAVSVSILEVPTKHGPVTFGHLPFEESALAASLDQLVATGVKPPPVFEQGYAQWKEAKGGVFTIGVDKVIALIVAQADKAMSQKPE
jgi:hypothetical protein